MFLITPLLSLAIVLVALWAAAALSFQAPLGRVGLVLVLGAWIALAIGALVALWTSRWLALPALFALGFAAILIWWSTILPSNARDFAPEVARAVTGKVEGSALTLDGIRNFDWRSEQDFTPRWETRRYDLDTVATLDLVASYWAGESIAHVLLSFGFSDGRYLVWSIELRREKTESYSVVASFFKQAELVAIAGDERDLLRLRTTIRGEDVRIYRLKLQPETIRNLLLQYVNEANDLAASPQWYNTVTSNCTTVLVRIARLVEPGIPLDWRILASGYFPDYAYDQKVLDQSLPFDALRERSRVSERAKAADALPSPAFSQAIRAGLPGMP